MMSPRSGWRRGSGWGGAAVALLLSLWLPLTASADPHWFSRSQVVGAPPDAKGAPAAQAGGPRDFDLTISLHNNPAGDNIGNIQGADPGSAEQDNFEQIIQHFADAVHASTEGCHRIRRVRIFRDGQNAATADVRWEASGHPKAHINGVSHSGRHIFMYDVFKDGSGPGVDFNLLGNPRATGYTLAHEWYHYAFGVFDEYVIQATDVSVEPSVMNNQWRAALNNDLRYLEFSVARQTDPPGTFENTEKTHQHRAFGLSVWEVLASAMTPVEELAGRLNRVVYPELAAAAPTGAAKPVADDLDSAAAREVLDIVWMSDANVYTIVIDRSGSMSGSAIANARTAANLLIDLAQEGSTQIGVVSFNSGATTVSPILPINSQDDKDTLKALVSAITTSGGTSIAAGADRALALFAAQSTSEQNRVCFLLSDGESNDALNPIPSYQAAQIPILTFAYGDGADTAALGQLATQTGGRLFISPTTLAEVSAAFQEANVLAGGNTSLVSESLTAPAGGPQLRPFRVDSTLSRIDVTAAHAGGAAAAMVALIAPDGSRLAPTSVSESGGETLRLFSVDAPLAGEWNVEIEGAAGPLDLRIGVSGVPAGASYALDVAPGLSETVTYPAPALITASLGRELPITGARVLARVTAPDASVQEVPLLDDGVAPDATQGDGIYTAAFNYTQDGQHEVRVEADNELGLAVESERGLSDGSPSIQGLRVPRDPDRPVLENFLRLGALNFQVSNVQADDHGDTTAAATAVTPGNSQGVTRGRIDRDGDPDVFSVAVPGGTTALTFRVGALASGMDPVVRILAADGTAELGRITAATPKTALAYHVLTLPVVGAPTTLFLEVLHASPTGRGTYALSVGEAIGPDADFPVAASGGGSTFINPDSSGGFCFVATAAYGSAAEPHVASLRRFRDDHLLTNAPGRAFVSTYYQLSPPLARWIAASEVRRQAARVALTPAVAAVEHPQAALAVALALLGLGGLRVARRRRRG